MLYSSSCLDCSQTQKMVVTRGVFNPPRNADQEIHKDDRISAPNVTFFSLNHYTNANELILVSTNDLTYLETELLFVDLVFPELIIQ